MPRKLQKCLQDYLNKIKNPTPEFQLSSSSSFPSPRKWMLRGCKHPKTLSFAIDHTRNRDHHQDGDSNKDDAATLSDVDRFLFENFRSLYINNEEEPQEKKDKEEDRVPSSSSVLFESPSRFLDPPPNICSSHRFFVAAGSSGSLMEDARASLTSNTSEDHRRSSSASTNTVNESLKSSAGITNVRLPDDCIAVLAYSPSPYEDFRKSMQEMVEDRLQQKGKVDWDFMEELLFCYLNLNEKRSHRFILSAFVDLIVRLRKTSNGAPPGSRRTRVARQRRKLETAT